MMTPSQPSGASQDPDMLHQLAFHSIVQLPQHDDTSMLRNKPPSAAQAESLMSTFTPEQRERTFNVASRRLSLQLLYEADLADARDSTTFNTVLAKLESVDGLGPMQAQRVRDLCSGAWTSRADADATFATLAPEWPTHRLAAIDRALLRLGYFEATSNTTPARIVIHECVELAKAFGTEKSPSFVNALLDKGLQAKLHSESASA